MKFDLEIFMNLDILRGYIKGCQRGNHIQQVIYSTYHDCLTQVCFKCQKVRTTMKKEDIMAVDE